VYPSRATLHFTRDIAANAARIAQKILDFLFMVFTFSVPLVHPFAAEASTERGYAITSTCLSSSDRLATKAGGGMKKVLIVIFAVAVLAGCATASLVDGRIYRSGGISFNTKYEGPDPTTSDLFETLTGIPAETVSSVEAVYIHSRSNGISVPAEHISLWRITSSTVTYVVRIFQLSEEKLSTLVIDGREVALRTATWNGGYMDFECTVFMALIPPEDVEGLFAGDDIRIQCWGTTIKLTEKEISALRLLSPEKPT
jgi:hypothetical protein